MYRIHFINLGFALEYIVNLKSKYGILEAFKAKTIPGNSIIKIDRISQPIEYDKIITTIYKIATQTFIYTNVRVVILYNEAQNILAEMQNY